MSERIPDEVLERVADGAPPPLDSDGEYSETLMALARELLAERAWRREAEGLLSRMLSHAGFLSVTWEDRARALLGGSDDA